MLRPETALITGASRGIGLAIARALAARGSRLALTARDAGRLSATAREVSRDAVAIAADLLDDDAPSRVVAEAIEQVGPPTVLINNAGTAPTARIEDTGDRMLDEALRLHVGVPLKLIRSVLPHMRDRGAGCIVQIGSTAGLRGFPFTSAYAAAKHAMVGLTRSMAEELRGSGIAVYAVCPGFVDTDLTREAAAAISGRGPASAEEVMHRFGAMNRIGRLHQPEEVAAAVAAICAERPAGCIYDLDLPTPSFV